MAETSGVSNRFTFASLPRTERGQPIVLGTDPKGENFLYCHGNSVIIRSLASPQMADVYTQHSCQVLVAKYSPSGFYIASADKVIIPTYTNIRKIALIASTTAWLLSNALHMIS